MTAQISRSDEPHYSGHEWSGSASLSGRGVIAAWLASLILHTFVIGVMFMLVFPFSPGGFQPPPVVEAQVVGDIDAPSDAAQFVRPLPEQTGVDRSPTRFEPDTAQITQAVEQFTHPSAMKEPDLAVLGIGTAGGDGGDLSDLGFGAAGGAAPQFFGAGGSVRGVRSVVYVVDRSGSMSDTFEHVREELKRSISSLRRSQKFHVIFFNSGPPVENPPFRLVNAVAGNRKAFFEFLSTVEPSGSTHPEQALMRALSMQPDLIYLLSDGINFDPALPPKLDGWNRERRSRIFTIAYLDPTGREMLEAIAREHRGEFKFVSEYDLP